MPSGQNINNRAFTLIELLVGICLAGMILALSFQMLSSVLSSGRTIAKSTKGFQATQSALNTITSDIKASNGISPASTEIKLVLVSGVDMITYEFIGKKIKRSVNSYGQYITDDNILKTFRFSYPFSGTALIESLPAGSALPFTSESVCRNI